MAIRFSGLDRLTKKLERFKGSQDVPLIELFDPDFVSRCSKFRSLNELVEACPVKFANAKE